MTLQYSKQELREDYHMNPEELAYIMVLGFFHSLSAEDQKAIIVCQKKIEKVIADYPPIVCETAIALIGSNIAKEKLDGEQQQGNSD